MLLLASCCRCSCLLSRSSCLCILRRSARSYSGPKSRVCLILGSELSYCCCCLAVLTADFPAALCFSALCRSAQLQSIAVGVVCSVLLGSGPEPSVAAVVLLLLQQSSQQVSASPRCAGLLSLYRASAGRNRAPWRSSNTSVMVTALAKGVLKGVLLSSCMFPALMLVYVGVPFSC